jgi:hypothetical protein
LVEIRIGPEAEFQGETPQENAGRIENTELQRLRDESANIVPRY